MESSLRMERNFEVEWAIAAYEESKMRVLLLYGPPYQVCLYFRYLYKTETWTVEMDWETLVRYGELML